MDIQRLLTTALATLNNATAIDKNIKPHVVRVYIRTIAKYSKHDPLEAVETLAKTYLAAHTRIKQQCECGSRGYLLRLDPDSIYNLSGASWCCYSCSYIPRRRR